MRTEPADSLLVASVKQGPNNYEWHVYTNDGTRLDTRSTADEARAFADGYNLGVRHGQWVPR